MVGSPLTGRELAPGLTCARSARPNSHQHRRAPTIPLQKWFTTPQISRPTAASPHPSHCHRQTLHFMLIKISSWKNMFFVLLNEMKWKSLMCRCTLSVQYMQYIKGICWLSSFGRYCVNVYEVISVHTTTLLSISVIWKVGPSFRTNSARGTKPDVGFCFIGCEIDIQPPGRTYLWAEPSNKFLDFVKFVLLTDKASYRRTACSGR